MKPLIAPTITICGTSKEQLGEQLLAVINAAQELISAMQAAAPHARDYPGNTISEAAVAWSERVAAVERVLDDVSLLTMKIALHGLD